MGEMMYFPDDPNEFLEQYSFKDKQEVYTNGAELIPVFRVKQMLEHYLSVPIREMTVREFNEMCCNKSLVLRDSYTGKVYTKIEKYLDKKVHGFYPRFYHLASNDTYNPWCGIQIVAWIRHDFTEDSKEKEG